MKVHCLFEQSGTFKKSLKRYCDDVFDYDILNDFGQTDYVIDLYSEIKNAYDGKKSVFDNMQEDDLVFAFFPCTRFETQCNMMYKGVQFQMKNWTLEKKLEYDLKIHSELAENYEVITKLTLICIRKKLRLIIENPTGGGHYLTRYWSFEPSVIITDRHKYGDYYKKPTQFWFLNCEPKNNDIEFKGTIKERSRIEDVNNKVARSLIAPEFADWFIDNYIFGVKRQEELFA